MQKFFTDDIRNNEAKIIEDAKHICNVLRYKIGDKITICDGTGTDYFCTLRTVHPHECVAVVDEIRESDTEPKIRVSLYQAIPKSGKMEVIIQKCVELGIYEIIPIETRYTTVKTNARNKMQKTVRWQKIAKEAAKQCGRGIIPVVHEPMDFKYAIARMAKHDSPIMLYEALGGMKELRVSVSNIMKKDEFANNSDDITIGIMIGSEGGFSPNESKYAEENGIMLAGMGKRILRTETAGAAVLAIIMYECNEL